MGSAGVRRGGGGRQRARLDDVRDVFHFLFGLLVFAIFGVVLSAGYILWMIQRVFHGPATEEWKHLKDASEWWEFAAIGALVIAIIGIGIYPAILTDVVEAGVAPIAAIVEAVS